MRVAHPPTGHAFGGRGERPADLPRPTRAIARLRCMAAAELVIQAVSGMQDGYRRAVFPQLNVAKCVVVTTRPRCRIRPIRPRPMKRTSSNADWWWQVDLFIPSHPCRGNIEGPSPHGPSPSGQAADEQDGSCPCRSR
jgi:hypothetical protein